MGNKRRIWARPALGFTKYLVLSLGVFGLLLCAAITVLIFVRGLPLFIKHGPAAVLLGAEWRPHNGKFGMLPLILSTLYSMVGALVLCVPFAVLAAVFIHGFLPKVAKTVCLNLMMTLARIPSVIYGLLGIVWVLPFLQGAFRLETGFSLLAVIIVLAAALLPQMLVALLLAIDKMPADLEKASRALGATSTETWFWALLPRLRRDIVLATFTCAGRAVGETIVIAMVAGSLSNMPNLFHPASTLAMEASGTFVGLDGETGTALFAVALVLLVFVAVLNILRSIYAKRGKGQ